MTPSRLLLSTAFLVGCVDSLVRDEALCPSTPAPGASVPFTAQDVLPVAAASHAGEATTTDDVPETFPVVVTDTFDPRGPAEVVDFGADDGDGCPTGLALRIPVVHHRTGTLGGWAFAQDMVGYDLYATAAAADAISLRFRDGHGGLGDETEATVDPELRALALRSDFAEDYAASGTDCGDPSVHTELWVGTPYREWAGSWARGHDDGELTFLCTDDASAFVRWGDGEY